MSRLGRHHTKGNIVTGQLQADADAGALSGMNSARYLATSYTIDLLAAERKSPPLFTDRGQNKTFEGTEKTVVSLSFTLQGDIVGAQQYCTFPYLSKFPPANFADE